MLHRYLIGLSITIWASLASATPYQLVATYTGKNADQTERTLKVKIANNAELPDRTDGLDLDSVAIIFERAGLDSTTSDVFNYLVVATSYENGTQVGYTPVDPKHPYLKILSSDIDPAKPRILLKWNDIHRQERSLYFDINILGVISSSILCSHENSLRQRPEGLRDLDDVSYCHVNGIDGTSEVNVESAQAENSAEFKEQKQRLNQLILQEMTANSVDSRSSLKIAPHGEDRSANVVAEDDFKFRINHVGELFVLSEADNGQPRPFAEVIDQRSTLIITANGGQVGNCPNLAKFKYVFEFKGDGDKATIDELPVKFRDACKSVLNVDLTKYLDKRVTMRILQRVDSTQDLTLVETQFTVANLGFQWTAPIVSEIVAALDAKSPSDLTASSSLPLGIALGRNGQQRLALSFAFRASWNIRSFTNLSRYFAAFGHLSVLSNPDQAYKTELAVGAGLSAFQFLHAGWAMSLADNHRNYFLLSIDIKDISKFLIAERSD